VRTWHLGPAEVPLTDQDLAAESSTSAVTVTGREAICIGTCYRRRERPWVGPPAWGRSLYPPGSTGRPTGRGQPPPWAAADHQGLVEQSREGWGLGSDPPGRELSLPTFVIRAPTLADRHAMSAPVRAGLLGHCQPDGSLTERPGCSTPPAQHLGTWAGPDRAWTAIPAACPNHVQIDSYNLHTAGRPTPPQWAGRRWRRAVLVRPRRRPLAGPPVAPGGSRE
jgi:hypothetical protein